MDLRKREQNIVTNTIINTTSMTTIGSELRNMPIPSPPSLSSSSEDEDSEDGSEADEESSSVSFSFK